LGQPSMECFFQLAISKQDPALYGGEGVFAKMAATVNRAWPENPDKDPTGFKWKITNGDSPRQDQQTQQWVKRAEHCAGNWIFNIKSHGYVANSVKLNPATNSHDIIMDPNEYKTGDYLDVIIKVEHNKQVGAQEGIYVNPALVRFSAPGEAITSGGMSAADADIAFAGMPAQAPVAALAQAPMAAPVQAPAQAPAQAPVVAPLPAPNAVPAPYDPNFAAGPTAPGTN